MYPVIVLVPTYLCLPHCRLILYLLSHWGIPVVSYISHMVILTGLRCYLTLVLICISSWSMIWTHSHAPLGICIISLEKYLFRFLAHFYMGLFMLFSLKLFIHLDINSTWIHDLQKFSPILEVTFSFCFLPCIEAVWI